MLVQLLSVIILILVYSVYSWWNHHSEFACEFQIIKNLYIFKIFYNSPKLCNKAYYSCSVIIKDGGHIFRPWKPDSTIKLFVWGWLFVNVSFIHCLNKFKILWLTTVSSK